MSKTVTWPTTIKVRCRNEEPFEALIVMAPGIKTPIIAVYINCPHCGRRYLLNMESGQWVSDRELTILDPLAKPD